MHRILGRGELPTRLASRRIERPACTQKADGRRVSSARLPSPAMPLSRVTVQRVLGPGLRQGTRRTATSRVAIWESLEPDTVVEREPKLTKMPFTHGVHSSGLPCAQPENLTHPGGFLQRSPSRHFASRLRGPTGPNRCSALCRNEDRSQETPCWTGYASRLSVFGGSVSSCVRGRLDL
jgi:hypothetical protein